MAELERTSPSSAATRYRPLQQLFNWLDDEGEIEASPMAKMRPFKIPEKPYLCSPMITYGSLLADCSGKGLPQPTGLRDHPALPGYRHAPRRHERLAVQSG